MLKVFVTLLLITGGITANISSHCKKPSGPNVFPETNEELQMEICKPWIEFLECEIRQDNPQYLQMAKRIVTTLRDVCSEDPLLHAAVVDNLKCFKKLSDDAHNMAVCGSMHESEIGRAHQLADILNEAGNISLTGNNTDQIRRCIEILNSFACHALQIRRECGDVAKNAFVKILQKLGPGVFAADDCSDFYDLLTLVIHLRETEEEKERRIAEDLKEQN